MGRRDDGCLMFIFYVPIYLLEILIKLAGTCAIGIYAINWVVLGTPIYFIMDLFGVDTRKYRRYEVLLEMLGELWNKKMFL